jgi:hypothetical protein
MRKQEVADLCAGLGLDVADCRVKQDYVNKVLAAMKQRLGTGATQQSDTDAAPPKPKVCIAHPAGPFHRLCAHTSQQLVRSSATFQTCMPASPPPLLHQPTPYQ